MALSQMNAWEQEVGDALKRAEQIRAPASVQNYGVEKIKRLRCFEWVKSEILAGTPARQVAAEIQAKGELIDLKPETVRRYLESYRSSLSPLQRIANLGSPDQLADLRGRVVKTLDVIGELESLFRMMKGRLEKVVSTEESLGFLLEGAHKEFQTALDILSRIHELKGRPEVWQKEEEPSPPLVEQIDWSLVYDAPNVNAVLKSADSRARILRFVETVCGVFGPMTAEKQERILEVARRRTASPQQK
ncbi:hypothetical protein WDW37_18165 [Bdellovibrionota bacterium FG-1]